MKSFLEFMGEGLQYQQFYAHWEAGGDAGEFLVHGFSAENAKAVAEKMLKKEVKISGARIIRVDNQSLKPEVKMWQVTIMDHDGTKKTYYQYGKNAKDVQDKEENSFKHYVNPVMRNKKVLSVKEHKPDGHTAETWKQEMKRREQADDRYYSSGKYAEDMKYLDSLRKK